VGNNQEKDTWTRTLRFYGMDREYMVFASQKP
jgi:hypothetical protein